MERNNHQEKNIRELDLVMGSREDACKKIKSSNGEISMFLLSEFRCVHRQKKYESDAVIGCVKLNDFWSIVEH